MTMTIIQEVLDEEQKATKSVEQSEKDFAQQLDEEKLKLEAEAQENITKTKEKYAQELESYQKKLDDKRNVAEKELQGELKKLDKITGKKIESVAQKILHAMK